MRDERARAVVPAVPEAEERVRVEREAEACGGGRVGGEEEIEADRHSVGRRVGFYREGDVAEEDVCAKFG